ncbi:MAG: spermidine synthase [Myxococcales bacterium]|nr:MAG: spermidine synthase [Myxococcales bacterium]
MKPRRVIDTTSTPDGATLQLVWERGHYVIRISGVTLMSSEMHGSEEAMAAAAAELLGDRAKSAKVLVGGLGMGFTLRAALDAFGKGARITVAELIPAVVAYNRGVLGPLAERPLADKRVTLYHGDVRDALRVAPWDAILMDVDNGPDAFTTTTNESLYDWLGVKAMAEALAPGGVLVLWSVEANSSFEKSLKRAGLKSESRRVRARLGAKGARHTLFIAQRISF